MSWRVCFSVPRVTSQRVNHSLPAWNNRASTAYEWSTPAADDLKR